MADITPLQTGESAQPTPSPTSCDRELRITIYQDSQAIFEGSAAQLEAEGLIPKGFEWPRAASDRYWEANGFDYCLCRTRP